MRSTASAGTCSSPSRASSALRVSATCSARPCSRSSKSLRTSATWAASLADTAVSICADWRRASPTSNASCFSRSSNAARASANWASSADSRCSKDVRISSTRASASCAEPSDVSRSARRASSGGAQLGALSAQRLDVRARVRGDAQLAQLGARGGGLLAGGGGVGAQLVGELAQRVEPLGGLGALARQLLEAAAVVAGQPLGLGLLDL